MVRNSVLLIFALLVSPVFGQVNRYVVFFKDKNGSAYSLSQPQSFLSQKALDRRSRQGVAVNNDDLPVNTSYINDLKSAGAKTYFSSRWLNCVLVEADGATAAQLVQLPSVKSVVLAAPNSRLAGGRIRQVRSRKETAVAAATQTQLRMLGLDAMQTDGYFGDGITIAVLDGGFLGVNTATPFQHIFSENRLLDSYDFVGKSGNVFSYDDHGTEVLSVIGAYSQDVFNGGAYKANFQLYVTEDVDTEYRVEEFNWLFAAERADSSGVDVISSSLGYNIFDDPGMDYSKAQLDGSTAIISKAASLAIARGIVVVVSAGNEGNNSWQLVTPPADVDGVLAIGSVTSTLSKSSFSSVGPTADNRIKPDVMALGSGTSVIKPAGTLGSASGTSLATPLITSLVAGLMQAYPQLTVSELYDVIIQSSSQFATPDNQKGYGIPNYPSIRASLETLDIVDEIAVYPNPVSGQSITIAVKHPSTGPIIVSIYTPDGKRVHEGTFTVNPRNNPVEYDLSMLAPGTYLVKVKSGDILKTVRLVRL